LLARHDQWAASVALHGLKVVAVAVVAQAVWGMAKTLCPDRPRAALAIGAALLTLLLPSAFAQVGSIVVCGLIGRSLLKLPAQPAVEHRSCGVSRRAGAWHWRYFAAAARLPLLALATASPIVNTLDAFWARAGVGGGHGAAAAAIRGRTGGWVNNTSYRLRCRAGVPPFVHLVAYPARTDSPWPASAGGPEVWFACWPSSCRPGCWWWAFQPWDGCAKDRPLHSPASPWESCWRPYDPVWTSAIQNRADFGLALAAFGLLVSARWSPLVVVALSAGAGWAMSAL
jgi:chromate transporter